MITKGFRKPRDIKAMSESHRAITLASIVTRLNALVSERNSIACLCVSVLMTVSFSLLLRSHRAVEQFVFGSSSPLIWLYPKVNDAILRVLVIL